MTSERRRPGRRRPAKGCPVTPSPRRLRTSGCRVRALRYDASTSACCLPMDFLCFGSVPKWACRDWRSWPRHTRTHCAPQPRPSNKALTPNTTYPPRVRFVSYKRNLHLNCLLDYNFLGLRLAYVAHRRARLLRVTRRSGWSLLQRRGRKHAMDIKQVTNRGFEGRERAVGLGDTQAFGDVRVRSWFCALGPRT